MPPKSNLPAAKLSTILTYLRTSLTAHTLKDLEKSLPSIASINSMAVKDYLQSLTDESQIHVEKIGSGNWYWQFASDETALRRAELSKLQAEYASVQANVGELEGKVRVAREERGDVDGEEREGLVQRKEELGTDVEALRRELDGYKDGDPGEVERKRREVGGFKEGAERWTDNLCVVEGYIGKVSGGDRQAIEGLRRVVYGEEYVEGEGLAEL